MAMDRRLRTGLVAAALLSCLVPPGPAAAQLDPVAGPLTVQNPRRLAGGPDGQLLVSDRQYGTIVAIDRASLQPVWSAQLPEGSEPFGLAVRNRLVFVGDTGTQTVGVYRINGSGGAGTRLAFAYRIGPADGGMATIRARGRRTDAGATPGAFARPIGLAVDGNQNLVFVLDGAAKTVSVFRRNGAFVSSFEPRDGAGALLSPVSLAVDTLRQEVLIGDYGNPAPDFAGCSFCGAAAPARILIYGYDGQLRFEIHGDGSTHSSARFARVQGLAASADGRIFAADPLGSRILVFDRISGALLQELGTDGRLRLPLDVLLDDVTGDLFVSNNRGARRIEVLRGAGGQP